MYRVKVKRKHRVDSNIKDNIASRDVKEERG